MNKQSEETKAVGETATFTDREEVQGGARAGRGSSTGRKGGGEQGGGCKGQGTSSLSTCHDMSFKGPRLSKSPL